MASPGKQHVIIIGAGLSGLALAHGLKKHGVSFRIFEREAAYDHRSQGYRMKLYPDTVNELQYLLPPKTFEDFQATLAITVLGETNVHAISGTVTASRPMWYGPQPLSVDRATFRSILLRGLEEDLVWNKAYTKYEQHGGYVTVHFRDGSTEIGTLLVGADGARSAIRRQLLPHLKFVDCGGCVIYGKTPFSDELLQRFPSKLLRWMTVLRDPTPGIQEVITGPSTVSMVVDAVRFKNQGKRQDLPPDYVYWGLLLPKKLLGPTEEDLSKAFQTPAKDVSLALTSEWDPSLRSLLELQDPEITTMVRSVSVAPAMEPWTPNDQVTLIGDAVHVMSPTGGVGCVAALKDAATLLKSLLSGGFNAQSIGAYEEAMRAYAKLFITRSFAGGKLMHDQKPFEECEAIEY